jgi:predicted MPP superfamily phosphohydrolase
MGPSLYVRHLSDLHLKTDEAAVERAATIAATLNGHAGAGAKLVVVFTGDIVFSGKPDEYDAARAFCSALQDALRNISGVETLAWLFVPGNHDCNFDQDSQARRIIISTLQRENPSAVDASVIETCTALQAAFFAFAAPFNGAGSGSGDRVYRSYDVTFDGKLVKFHLLNTAWVSQLKERQGELVFPYALIPSASNALLEVALCHHPASWLEANNARNFRAQLEQCADLVLTGHEHEASAYERRTLDGTGAMYVEGAVLFDTSSDQSGFNIIDVAIDGPMLRVYEYAWDGQLYARRQEPEWQLAARNRGRGRGSLRVTTHFLQSFVDDPGAPFTHPHKGRLTLDDIYVAPDLTERDIVDTTDSTRSSKIASADAISFLLSNPRVVLIGPEDSGKTAALKRLFAAHLAAGRVPLWISGDEIKRSDVAYLGRLIDRLVEQQYGSDSLDTFRQRSADDRVMIVDDFHRAKCSARGANVVINHLAAVAKTTIVSIDDLFEFQRVAAGSEAGPLLDFKVVEIRPFGHQLRGELIDKWLRLGREFSLSEADLSFQVRKAENAVDTLMGRSLFPAYPLFVLTVLQTMEAMTALNTAAVGTYGYVYEALITAKLSGSHQISLDTKYNFLTFVAFSMFAEDDSSPTQLTLHQYNDRYFEMYRVRLPLDHLLLEFSAAGILQPAGDGYAFRYKYVYYYFVARYLAQALADPDLEADARSRTADLVSELFREEYANILLFLLYLSKDRKLLKLLFEQAASLNRDIIAAKFEDDVEFVSQLDPESSPLLLPDDDAATRVRSARAYRDASEHANSGQASRDASTLNVSMKTIQILGQVLRNFAGSLPAKLKLDIASTVCELGLRSITSVLIL